MTSDGATWLVAVLQVGTAVGIVAFWTWWLRTDHDVAWWPPGFAEHERAFVVPDSVLAAVLTGSAVLSVLEHEAARSLALVAVGMLLFLALIDTAYFARQGMFARDRDGVANTAIVGWMFTLAAILAVRYV